MSQPVNHTVLPEERKQKDAILIQFHLAKVDKFYRCESSSWDNRCRLCVALLQLSLRPMILADGQGRLAEARVKNSSSSELVASTCD